MRRYIVTFEVFRAGRREYRSVTVEAGTKKRAMFRAMTAINKQPGYAELYKTIKSIEEEK